MSARSVPSGIRPSRSHSRRPISEPPRRPATAIRTPFAPAFIERWIACFIAFLKAIRRVSCWAMFIATRWASSSGWRISLISSLTRRFVRPPICWRRISTFAPPLPMTIPGFAVWIVTVTWLIPRSISTPDTLALASRRSTSLRIVMSSLMRSVYSLSAYHFAVQVRETPNRKPYGWTLRPISGLLIRDNDGDVSHWLVDRERPTLGAWPPALDRPALVGVGLEDDEGLGGQVVVVLGVGRGAVEDPLDVAGGVLGHELEERGGLFHPPAADRGGDEIGLAGRPAKVPCSCGNAHLWPLLLQRRGPLGVLAVPAIRAGVGELAEAMADHVLGHVDRDVLLAVVDGDRVTDERREDERGARPGLDDLLLVALVHFLYPPLEAELDERALLDRTGHALPPSATCDDVSGRSAVRSSWIGGPGPPAPAAALGLFAPRPPVASAVPPRRGGGRGVWQPHRRPVDVPTR